MSLIINGIEIPSDSEVFYNGVDLDKVVCDGVTVWEKIVFTSQDFEYAGYVEEFTAPMSGLYKLEVWGAEGGYENGYPHNPQNKPGGKGGYSIKYVYLALGTKIYVCVGGAGGPIGTEYNGGGEGDPHARVDENGYFIPGKVTCAGGGGATHMATTNRGVLESYEAYKNEVILVAGGGGSGGSSVTFTNPGGDGGGLEGGVNGFGDYFTSGKQTEPGLDGTLVDENDEGEPIDPYINRHYMLDAKFGSGAKILYKYRWHNDMDEETDINGLWDRWLHGWTGGGGGWYGGTSGTNFNSCVSAAGGSGYIGAETTEYRGIVYQNQTISGQRFGDGHARITFICI